MNREQLNKILENHKHWILRDCEGWGGMRADLCGANLYRANLCGANLCKANLCGANLWGADLYRADLRGADLCGANLCKANLCGANLWGANLRDADLRGADLYRADLRGADLCGAKNIPFIPIACPEEGVFIGYKKAKNKIIKLEICKDARRSSATGRKCRCDKAKVLSITKLDGSPTTETEVSSNYDETFIYKIGEIVEEPNFCEDRFDECAEGVHFFINRQEAVEY